MFDANGDAPSQTDEAAKSVGKTVAQKSTGTSAPDSTHLAEVPGTLLWLTTEGEFRELAVADASTVTDSAPEAGDDRHDLSCRRCGSPALAEAVIREHAECGHVAVDGFVHDDGPFGCPKCGTEAETVERFQEVTTVTACLACGDLLTRRFDA